MADRTQATTDLLTKAGYIYQSSAGIYTLMPMAQRVIEKIERIIDEEMHSIGGQKMAMPNLLTPENWKKTGRWDSTGSELFTFKDRKGSTLILGPTHEEEVTGIVKEMVRSYRQYPLRLYQITRKFRDEARPRAGLLRDREFVMKDMYSFDVTADQAIETFGALEAAYRRCFDRIGVPYMVADADSGNIGGSLSKEFHFINGAGEDTLYECNRCGYTANEERAQSKAGGHANVYVASVMEGSRRVKTRLVAVPQDHEPSALKIRQAWPIKPNQRIELALFEGSSSGASQMEEEPLVDYCTDASAIAEGHGHKAVAGDWHVAKEGDGCARCSDGVLKPQRAIEVGHIFYLGDKYSKAMDLSVLHQGQRSYVQMGCFGIGISRILQAAAECSNDDGRGLRWPLAIAPYLGSIVPLAGNDCVAEVFSALSSVEVGGKRVFEDNLVVDDRDYLSAGFRLNDAQLLGIPLTVVLGKRLAETGEVEVQIRMPRAQLPSSVAGIAVEGNGYEYKASVPLGKLGEFTSQVLH
ncbi:prolyl-tRNA synthetase [Martensiomyces pterosporus]|nr:prolyl-tRNA synthetase [Martensiomyces pterosporus]